MNQGAIVLYVKTKDLIGMKPTGLWARRLKGPDGKFEVRQAVGRWKLTSYPKPDVTFDDIRQYLPYKVAKRRPAILERLEQMGVDRISRLVPTQYATFYNFLKSL